MRRSTFAILVAALALAGCTRGPPQENVDQRDYTGGTGIALALHDNSSYPFHVNVTVRDSANHVLASVDRTLAAHASFEKWWSLPPSAYDVRMVYGWNGTAGHASTGFDDRVADVGSCGQIVRLGWSYMSENASVSSRFDGPSCIASPTPK